MATYSTNEFRSGLKVMLDGDPCAIVENEFVKPGKGQAFNRVRLKNLKTGRTWERTFKSGESIEAADVVDVEMQYLYTDGEFWSFMDPNTFDQKSADKNAVSDAAQWLKEQDLCVVTLWNDAPLSVLPPNHVELDIVDTDPGLRGDTAQGGTKPATLDIVDTDPGLRGDTAQGGTKPATLSTGAVVKVPLFLEIGEVIKVDTRNGEYLSRAKDS